MHGFSSGVLVCAGSKLVEGTVPHHLHDYGFNTSTNFFIATGILVTMLIGIGLPPESDWEITNYWVVFYLFPIPISLISIFFLIIMFKFEDV